MLELVGPSIAAAYDFGAWGSLMDVGGGNGICCRTFFRAHAGLRGVLATRSTCSNGRGSADTWAVLSRLARDDGAV